MTFLSFKLQEGLWSTREAVSSCLTLWAASGGTFSGNVLPPGEMLKTGGLVWVPAHGPLP